MPQTCIQIHNLNKRYKASDEDSLKDISFSIKTGDRFGILGPNGAGKTTLISIICGVLTSTKGYVDYYSQNNTIDLDSFKKKTGFVPQEHAFYQELTPKQNLEYFGAFYNLPPKELKANMIEILDKLGLSKVADKKINTFSGGMKRRINLAIGIIHKPDFLFLDEPTVGVDVQSKNAIMKFLIELNEQGTTIIYTSHLLSEVESFCNNIALIDHGKLIAQDTLSNLLSSYHANDLESLFINLTGEAYRDK
ncbi:MAG: ABC transporter ATP-binding protein [Bacteroidota bacterium]